MWKLKMRASKYCMFVQATNFVQTDFFTQGPYFETIDSFAIAKCKN